MQRLSLRCATAILFAATFAFVYWAAAQRFVMSNDEGIFLEGSLRILQGQVPYRDFFLLMGPGSMWLQAAAMKIFGVSLIASRLVTMLDVSAIAACMFWLIAQRANRALGAFTAAAFVILETADPVVALPNHRWDSAALAMVAITLAATGGGRLLYVAAGACAAAAAWATPSVGLVALTLTVFLAMRNRQALVPFLTGGAVLTFAAMGFLALQGGLGSMARHMLWTASNYSGPNFMPYGSIVGGYERFFDDAHGQEIVARSLITVGVALPALIPPLVLLLLVALRKWSTWTFLLLAAVTMVATTYPRMDVPHLAYASPLWYVLLALSMTAIVRPKIRLTTFTAVSLIVSIFFVYIVAQRIEKKEILSNMGTVRANTDDSGLIHSLENEIPRGSELFVYPYLPVLYFITQTHNPTRYSYLQPGLMTEEDENTALQELAAAPQAKILYYDFLESELLKIWPNTDPKRTRLRRIEQYIHEHYRTTSIVKYRKGEFLLMERVPSAIAAN